MWISSPKAQIFIITVSRLLQTNIWPYFLKKVENGKPACLEPSLYTYHSAEMLHLSLPFKPIVLKILKKSE